jgi:hypothetical protein
MGCGSFQLVTFTKSWTFEAPGWTMMGPLCFFLQLFFIFYFFLQRGFFGFFIPSVNSTKKICQKIEEKNPGGGASGYSFFFLGANFCPLAVFPAKKIICQIFPYKLPKIGKKKILENCRNRHIIIDK